MLFNEPKLLKSASGAGCGAAGAVSVLFNEPKLLKSFVNIFFLAFTSSFSALQRAEIAEIRTLLSSVSPAQRRFSALQRAEIAEMGLSNAKSE